MDARKKELSEEFNQRKVFLNLDSNDFHLTKKQIYTELYAAYRCKHKSKVLDRSDKYTSQDSMYHEGLCDGIVSILARIAYNQG